MRSRIAGAAPLARLATPRVLRSAVVLAGAMLLVLAWTRNVNWDEFFYLSKVHAHLDGRLTRPLQNAYVHAFGWLARLPGHEMGQIFAARLVMTALLAATAVSIHRVSAALADRTAADIAVVAFLSSGFVLAHGASFRADPIAAACLMVALAIAMTGRMAWWQVAAVALLGAASLLVTIKAALYLPAYLGAILWRSDDRRVVGRIVLAGIGGLVVAAALYSWHASGVAASAGRETAASAGNALRTTLLSSGLIPQANFSALWTLLSLGAVILAAAGLAAPGSVRDRLVRMSFVLPLVLSVLFYRNSFPYFFPYISPPLMVVSAIGAAWLARGPWLGALVALMLVSGTGQGIMALREGATLQRETLAEVHRLFPEPVAYIDSNGMVSTFPREGFFMSTWGLSRYRARGVPVMEDILERTAPPLLLANRGALRRAMKAPGAADGPTDLLPEDAAALRAAYVHHDGAIWLAGREMVLDGTPQAVSLPIPGRYRLESEGPVTVDGREVADGAMIEVEGPLTVSGAPGLPIRLVWDTPGGPDADPLPRDGDPLYAGFWTL